MGLTNKQIDSVVQMIEQSWGPLERTRVRIIAEEREEVFKNWNVDPRVVAFANNFEVATGQDWHSTMTYPISSYRASMLELLQRNWSKYADGSRKGLLYDALADAGYSPKPAENASSFYTTPQCAMLNMALRTTRKNWGTLSDLVSDFVVQLSLAPDIAAIKLAVQTFTDALK